MKWHSKLSPILLLLVLFAGFVPTVSAKNPPAAGAGSASTPTTHRPRKRLYFGMGTSTAECVVGIVLSKNPATAAEIGLPILFIGNYVAIRLYNKHPKWSGFIQNMSGLGCIAGALTRHAPKPPIHTIAPPTTPPGTPTSGPSNPPGSPKPPHLPGPCTIHGGTDCGFGNGGINPSHNPLPPVNPPGGPHTHGKLW